MASEAILESYHIQEGMLSFMGCWHCQKITLPSVLRGVTAMVIFLVAYTGMMLQNFHVSFRELAEGLYLSTSYTTFLLKLILFFMRRKPFLQMMDQLKNPMFASYPDHLEVYLKAMTGKGIFVAKVYRAICFSCVFLSSLTPFVDGNLPMPLPFDVGRYFMLVYIIEIAAFFIAVWINHCLDTLCACLMSLAAGQLDVLKRKIMICHDYAKEQLGKNDIHENDVLGDADVQLFITHLLSNCVKHHTAIIRYVKLIERVFSIGIIIQLLGSIVVICNTGFFLLIVTPFTGQFNMLVLYFIAMMSQLSLYCWFGNEVIVKSSEICDACYLADWQMYDSRARKLLFIIMERSKTPLEIRAADFTNLSLSTFSSIIRWSYSYFALLQRLAVKMNLL